MMWLENIPGICERDRWLLCEYFTRAVQRGYKGTLLNFMYIVALAINEFLIKQESKIENFDEVLDLVL